MQGMFGSRRDFLMRVGQAGGSGAAFAAMQAMGLHAALAAHRAIQMIAERMQSEKLIQPKKKLTAA